MATLYTKFLIVVIVVTVMVFIVEFKTFRLDTKFINYFGKNSHRYMHMEWRAILCLLWILILLNIYVHKHKYLDRQAERRLTNDFS